MKIIKSQYISMPGGLIQIATYGSQDLFLTGTPEITFFKIVYRRHTNFSLESIKLDFDDQVSFGSTSSIIIPKIGDLIHKSYIEITLPEIHFNKVAPTDTTFSSAQYTIARNNYDIVTNFMKINRNSFIAAYDIYIPENNPINKPSNMINATKNVFNEVGNDVIVFDFLNLLYQTPTAPFTYNEVSLLEIVNTYNGTSDATDIYNALLIGINKSIKTQKYFYNEMLSKKQIYENDASEFINFAWVDRIGHAIIESIEIRLGGSKIDKHYGDWLNIWYELTKNKSMDKIYRKMIGDVPILTNFNRTTKPSYTLKVPLQFWFCRFSGLALPIIALEYHDVSFHVNFRKLIDVSYIEFGKTIKYINDADGLNLDEVTSELNINISANLLIDYIYLDSPERRRFAQSSHEYLIEQVQYLEIPNVSQNKIQCIINNFVHPTKELVWVSQKNKYSQNFTGYTKNQFFNYSYTDAGNGNPIIFSELDFHSYTRVPKLDGNYYNYVQPYETHNHTPSDGINMYSFALSPEEFQPSGSVNMGRLSRIALNLEFIEAYVNEEPFDIRIYATNVNVLRFISGLSGLAYVYG